MKKPIKMFKNHKIVEYAWLVIVVLLFIVSIQTIKNGYLISHIDSFGILAPLIFILLKASTLVIAPLGGLPLYFIAGSLFGNINGFVLALLGDAFGSSVCFLLSRFYGHKIVKALAGDKFFEKVMNTVGVLKDARSFIKARIALLAVPEILAYASGLSKISFWTFFLINILFYLPADFLLVFFGSQVLSMIAEHTFLFYFFVIVISIAGFWFLYKDYKKLDNVEGM